MKKFILLFASLLLIGCGNPLGNQDSKTPGDKPVVKPPVVETPDTPKTPDTPSLPVYVPPAIDGAAETIVLRAPPGMVAASIARGAIAQADPLIGACNEPGTVYMFYDDGALVQYKPQNNQSYPSLAMSAKMTVDIHNDTHPESEWWDFISVPAPGKIYDFSHDPPVVPLEIRFTDNYGNLATSSTGDTLDYFCADASEYASLVGPTGTPKTTLALTFETWVSASGDGAYHIQMGGDGISIPPSTFHY